MHHRKGKKILIYFFLFLIVGSINNTALTKIQFEKIKNIKISGLNHNQNVNLSYNQLFKWICFFGIGANRP